MNMDITTVQKSSLIQEKEKKKKTRKKNSRKSSIAKNMSP